MDYQLRLATDAGQCQQLNNGLIRLTPNDAGILVLNLSESQ